MGPFLLAIWQNSYDLLVEDGSIAFGTLGALVVVGLFARLSGSLADAADLAGPLLLILLMGLLVGNLYRTGRKASRKDTGAD